MNDTHLLARLRAETPVLEPEPAFVDRLATAARLGAPVAVSTARVGGRALRVALAAVAALVLAAGGAFAARSLSQGHRPSPAPPASTPVDLPTPTDGPAGSDTTPARPGAGIVSGTDGGASGQDESGQHEADQHGADQHDGAQPGGGQDEHGGAEQGQDGSGQVSQGGEGDPTGQPSPSEAPQETSDSGQPSSTTTGSASSGGPATGSPSSDGSGDGSRTPSD